MIDVMGCGEDGCNGLSVADFVCCTNNVVYIQTPINIQRLRGALRLGIGF